MKTRFALYALLAVPFGILSWVRAAEWLPAPLGSYPFETTAVVWLLAGLAIAVYETRQSRRPALTAAAVALFWLAALLAMDLYWAGVVFLGYGGEQLSQFQIGSSPTWLMDDLQFYRHTMLPFLLTYGALFLVAGPLFGGLAGWLLLRSGLLKPAQLESIH